ncbi:Oidioi.mRNA.OKI2018_I69.chr1.g2755.t1.cds [Oikopleura dioica]|uniref:Oidioi.mRNA.OKI2018_I69.chr1.g2755.t1.cds n=1 Tax=Oikopleura dioica TaxID=34765 RepID=A0ABN7SYH1_OIKDI|nr:Oidioi.mRNA.OKI2018_I69.chr1.g2755.t1.cds [Oikopleura dioica]
MSGTSHLRLRSAAYGNPPTVGPVTRPGLVLIEKPKMGDSAPSAAGFNLTGRSSVMSDDILKLARIEAKRMRRAKSAIESPTAASAIQMPPSEINVTQKKRDKHMQNDASSSKSKFSSTPSKVNSKISSSVDVKRQLEHLRNEIEGMATQLADEVPSDVEDVDKDFDDESNRWFAREFYAVKHETTLIKRMRDERKQKNGVVKLHRTALRLMQVAASRPILRVLNPHIYTQLGDLVRELTDLSSRLDLPLWEPHSILEALEQAVYFPPRKNTNRRQSINPSDVAELLKPKNRKSQSRIKLKESESQNREPRSRTSQIQFDLPTKIYSDTGRGTGGFVNKKKSILKNSKTQLDDNYEERPTKIKALLCAEKDDI